MRKMKRICLLLFINSGEAGADQTRERFDGPRRMGPLILYLAEILLPIEKRDVNLGEKMAWKWLDHIKNQIETVS